MARSSEVSSPEALQSALLAWYDANARELPWRAKPGETPDPYRVWLSEIMLQQTTVAAVRPYFETFTARWPTVAALASASDETVMAAWAGLGYYARARNLLKCARHVAGSLGGRFPDTEAGLLTLPGIGPYTAAAIAAIAFGRAANVVDGNVERVMARLRGIETPLPAAKPELKRVAAELVPPRRAGDYAQALMDLGATVCRPKAPLCEVCPLAGACVARAEGSATRLPARAPKSAHPVRHGVAFWVETDAGEVLVRQRPPRGLLGGMAEIPSTEWRGAVWRDDEALGAAPVRADWQPADTPVVHTFTHFRLELRVWLSEVAAGTEVRPPADPGRCTWVPLAELDDQALPSVMRKVAHIALSEVT